MVLRRSFKDMAKDLYCRLGIPGSLLRLAGLSRRPRLFIFTYHRVCDASGSASYLAVPSSVFESHMRFIKNNFKIVSLLEGVEILSKDTSGGMYAAITFDDGYMDNYLNAFPILKKHNVPATIFLTTDFIGKDSLFWWDRIFNVVSQFQLNGKTREEMADDINSTLLRKKESEIESLVSGLEARHLNNKDIRPCAMLGWDEAREMRDNGLIDFGSHTKTHQNLCLLNDTEALEELRGSKKKIEQELDIEVNVFCYPYGLFDKRVKDLISQAGFKCARSASQGSNSRETDRFSLNYIGVGSLLRTDFLAARVSSNLFKTRNGVTA
ncbi:MAG: polysaccharide deacetylase family protein [Candidatus Gorgyraea atricola]|nr:polysaccharide deacetylase family protein [Candidatus Gorgyraea atricola]